MTHSNTKEESNCDNDSEDEVVAIATTSSACRLWPENENDTVIPFSHKESSKCKCSTFCLEFISQQLDDITNYAKALKAEYKKTPDVMVFGKL
jgi:hypothetical protein